MARKQSDYLAALLAEDEETASPSPSAAPAAPIAPAVIDNTPSARPSGVAEDATPAPRADPAPAPAPAQSPRAASPGLGPLRGTTLLNRESALARVASGEVRQVTQLLLDPARVRVWAGNARSYAHLSEESCRELIDSIIAEGGQKVPAVVRRLEGDPAYDYEVIAGTRRHWSIAWLRANSYPQFQFLAQVAQLDDEAAFRLADLENRARKDVSDLERARNYALALKDHYGNHLTRMAERLKLSKGWLSKMLRVATIPDAVIDAFASPADVQLKPGYALAQALDDKNAQALILKEARQIAREQDAARSGGRPMLASAEVLQRLLTAPSAGQAPRGPLFVWDAPATGRCAVSVLSAGRQGVTLKLHNGTGATTEDLVEGVRAALEALESQGKGMQR
ncbi:MULTISPECIES: ParB/RepB/Spo0J family partition protein [unclassified Novosphingobium]|uniref:ParB/RepB/Spo0J family partition protein n=1 Tax=unclassified Novosphingobium TaxID=2644732 RepID=UPI00146B2AC3|nr:MULTISPECIES: ParB/RepB/Spo0J family partition protein [unclassified Novosphingobium]NMN05094.1 ParB family chromosome partitioning protein [Novosphingobium sp. SG919]NMN87389.1 ParB family chromosome partitioning protein [Novosphingobium sp. SG916]